MVGESGAGNVSSLCKADRKAALRDIKRHWRVEGLGRWTDGWREGGTAAAALMQRRGVEGGKQKELIKAESGAPAERSSPQRDAAGADIRRFKGKKTKGNLLAAGVPDSKLPPGE